MNPETQQNEATTSPETQNVNVNNEEGGAIAKVPPSEEQSENWQQVKDQVLSVLSGLFDYVGQFFGEYRRPITNVALLVLALIALDILLAVLDAVNDIPLIAPLLELVGLGYSIWFVIRYMLRASTRQELSGQVQSLTDQVLGKGS